MVFVTWIKMAGFLHIDPLKIKIEKEEELTEESDSNFCDVGQVRSLVEFGTIKEEPLSEIDEVEEIQRMSLSPSPEPQPQVITPKQDHLCPKCRKTFLDDVSFFSHYYSPYSCTGTLYNCNACHFSSFDRNLLLQHVNTRHRVIYRIPGRQKLKKAPKRTAQQSVSCPNCSLQFPTKASLVAHLKDSARKPKRNTCRLCNRIFSRNDLLRSHLAIHKGESPIVLIKPLFCSQKLVESMMVLGAVVAGRKPIKMKK